MKKLEPIFEKLNMDCTPEKEKKFLGYMEGILEKNQFINLTAITDREEFLEKHYGDSLLCGTAPEFTKAQRIIDVGTGGGFPGIPLAIAFPGKSFVLVDSLNKRIKIIEELCEKLHIANVTAIHGRAEELARREDLRESFDLCVSRAVANMSTLTEYCLPFVKVGGTFIAYKGPDCEQEIEEAGKAIASLGGKLMRQEEVSAEAFSFRHRLIYVRKVSKTLSKYPRKPGTPSKEPIK